MYAVAFAILRNSDDAADAVQDAMSILWQKHDELNVNDNLQGYCCRTIRNICIDRLRLGSVRYFESIDKLYMVASDSATDSEVSYGSMSACISDILLKFKEKQRRVLALSIFSQLSNDEICCVMGESSENVRAILSRGRRKIKECLKDEK